MIAQCTVDYVGRLTAHLPSARRLLLIKADGSVSVHADDRAYKPLNWMSPPCWLVEDSDGLVWVVDSADRRRLEVCRQELHALLLQEVGACVGSVCLCGCIIRPPWLITTR